MQDHNTFVLDIIYTMKFFTNTHDLYLKIPKTSAKGKYLMVCCHDNITWLPFNILFLMEMCIVAIIIFSILQVYRSSKLENRGWYYFEWIEFPNIMQLSEENFRNFIPLYHVFEAISKNDYMLNCLLLPQCQTRKIGTIYFLNRLLIEILII